MYIHDINDTLERKIFTSHDNPPPLLPSAWIVPHTMRPGHRSRVKYPSSTVFTACLQREAAVLGGQLRMVRLRMRKIPKQKPFQCPVGVELKIGQIRKNVHYISMTFVER